MEVIRDLIVTCVLFLSKCKYLELWILAVLVLKTLDASPVEKSHVDINSYLIQFGYLPSSKDHVANLIHEGEYINAIKRLQSFAGLEVTGEIDEETKKILSTPRCGRPDVEDSSITSRRKRYVVQGPKWDNYNLTWSLSTKYGPKRLSRAGTREALRLALNVWEKNSRLSFREVNSDQADIVVSFLRGNHQDLYPFDGPKGVLAHAFFPGSGQGGDAHFDDDESWVLGLDSNDMEDTSVFAVAAHEFGHSLGLGHSTVKKSLMFPWYQGSLHPDFELHEDDKRGIASIYGSTEFWGRIPSYVPYERRPTRPTTTSTTTTTRKSWSNFNPHQTPDQRPHHSVTRRPTYPFKPNKGYTTEHRRPHVEPTKMPVTPQKPEKPKKKYPEKPYRPTATPQIPDHCDMSYDAVTMIRGDMFIFKDNYHWRIGANGPFSGYPHLIKHLWHDIPTNLVKVDAAYERHDGTVAFFIGRKMYVFDVDTRRLVYGYPKSLTALGLPPDLETIDAAMIWGHNNKTYFYSGTQYWKFDERKGKVEYEYPRDMSMWKGIGYNIDSVFQWRDGKTYFFKGKGFWKFIDVEMRVEKERQIPSGPFWFKCPPRRHRSHIPAPTESLILPSTAAKIRQNHLFGFIWILFVINSLLVPYVFY